MKRENVCVKILNRHHVRMFDYELLGIEVDWEVAIHDNPRHPKAVWDARQDTFPGLLDLCGEIANIPDGDERWRE